MSFSDEYNALKKKRKKETEKTTATGNSFSDQYAKLKETRATEKPLVEDIAPLYSRFSAPVKTTTTTTQKATEERVKKKEEKKQEEEERTWFRKGAFDDGYQFGDISKTILGTTTDIAENLGAGIIGMGEKVVDAFAALAPYTLQSQLSQNAIYHPELQKKHDEIANQAKKEVGEFIKKDLYDEEEIAKAIVLGTDRSSVLGEKSDALVQSAGQLGATVALQGIGVPWFVTTGVTSFGSGVESALNDGASFEQAGMSAVISAGAEVLTEKLSGGISFGGKTLDDALTKTLARKISNKAVRTMAKLGMDAVGEGSEEVISQVISNLGTSLYKEEKLSEILASEESVDEYIESFIGGAVLGGGMSGVNAIQSGRQGVDYVSELTANEQKVVDKEYKDRIAEEEKNGKVTDKRKSKIYDEVLRDMERGYISTDTIEEVLGGEAYTAYSNLKSEADEFNTLYDTESGKLSEKQRDRLAELKAKNEAKSYESALQEARNKLSESVSGLTKGDRLVESYNERLRATQDFEADFDKYKGTKHEEAARKTLESVIALGASNTNRVHDMVDLAAKTAGDTGLSITFATGEQVKSDFISRQTAAINEIENIPEAQRTADQTELLAAMKDQLAKVESGENTVNGNITEGGIVLNLDSSNPLNRLVGHEVTHSLKNSKNYQALHDAMLKYAKDKNIDINKKLIEYKAKYAGVKNADPESEMVADMVGDFLFSDADFVHKLSTENQNVFQWLWDEIKYLCKVATAGSKEARDLARVQKAFEDAYRNSGTQSKAHTNTATPTINNGFVGAYSGMTINADQAELLSALSAEALQNAEGLAGRQDITFNVLGLGGDKQTQQKWVDAGLAYVEQNADGDEYYAVNDAYLLDERARRNEAQKNTAEDGGTQYSIERTQSMSWADQIKGALYNGKNIRRNDTLVVGNPVDTSVANEISNKPLAIPQSILTKASSGKDISHSIKRGKLAKLDEGIKHAPVTIVNPDRNAVVYVTNITQGGLPVVVSFDMDSSFDGDDVHKATSIHLQVDTQAMLESLPDSATVYVQKNELDPVGATNNLRGLAAKIKFIGDTVPQVQPSVNSLSDNGERFAPTTSFDFFGKDFFKQEIAPVSNTNNALANTENVLESEVPVSVSETTMFPDDLAPMVDNPERFDSLTDADVPPPRNRRKLFDVPEEQTMTVEERRAAKLKAVQTELANDTKYRMESLADYNQEIARLQAEYDSKKNKNTKVANDILRRIERVTRLRDSVDADYAKRISDLQAREKLVRDGKPTTRQEYHKGIMDNIKARFQEKGFDFDNVLRKAKNLSTFATVDNTPQRVMEKALGYKEGQVLGDITVNQAAQNESEGIKWLNSYTDRKSGVLAQLSKRYNIKPGSKESAAAQMYAEGFYVAENNDIIEYGDAELAKDFPDANVQANIKGLASDPRIRRIYDDTLAMINESRTRNAYPEIPRLDNYFLHFRAMDDTFSKLGLPFNPNDIRAKDLPTDLNGVTADLKPGQPYFASAMHRTGKRTSFDLLGGLERYLSSAKNQIYHIDDIQTLRALRNYIADTYGNANGLEGLDSLSEEEAQERIEKVYNAHLSTFAKFLNEEANVLAGKTALIDRGLEGILGRRGMAFLDTVNKQVGSNMVGFNISSSLTNFLPVAQTFAKTNKADFVKAFAQTVAHKVSGRSDGFAEQSPVIIRRKGADRFYRTPWQKAGDVGYTFMSAVDDISTELIARTKYNELTRKGMDSQKAHFETDKWVSRLMGDRSIGQQPQLYNSKMLGLITKFQLEVRNQLDSQFYDTIQEAKVSSENIESELAKNAKTAAKVASTFVQLAVAQHLFGKAFESVAGYNPAFDIIEVLLTAFGFDDDEDSEDTVLDNIEQGFLAMLEDLPYTSTFTGGRIPISSALPIKELVTGKDDYGSEKSRLETLGEVAPYYALPGGYGQIKKTVQGLRMFSDDHPVAGSYTDSGNLRFPVDDTIANRVQAGIFGQYASENARGYFDDNRKPLNETKTEEFVALGIPIADYWEYRDEQSKIAKQAESEGATDKDILKSKYLSSVNDELSELHKQKTEIQDDPALTESEKRRQLRSIEERFNELAKECYESYNHVTIDGDYAHIGDRYFQWYTPEEGEPYWRKLTEAQTTKYLITSAAGDANYATDGTLHYRRDEDGEWTKISDRQLERQQEVTQELGITPEEYWSKTDISFMPMSDGEYEYAYDNPENYAVAKAVGGYDAYKAYSKDLYNIKADKDASGKSISGSRKEKVADYINNLDADYYTKIILFKNEYNADDTYNMEIIEYLNGREDISYEEMETILKKLGFDVDAEGNISW